MASTTHPPRNQAPGNRPAPTLVPGGGRQRRWSLALLAILITLGSALAFVVLWMNAGGREPVLALRNNVAAGQPIRADDLMVVRVSADSGVDLFASARRDEVVDQPAATNLLAGMLLVEDAVGDDDDIATGTAVIAIPVPAEQIPAGPRRTQVLHGGPHRDAVRGPERQAVLVPHKFRGVASVGHVVNRVRHRWVRAAGAGTPLRLRPRAPPRPPVSCYPSGVWTPLHLRFVRVSQSSPCICRVKSVIHLRIQGTHREAA